MSEDTSARRTEYNNKLTKDPFEMEHDELQMFFVKKEKQYARRRQKIADLCEILDLVNNAKNSTVLFKLKSDTFVYAEQYKLAYCVIPKVSE